jgi:FlaA1/EpsC-like NDP-sugar epimerase
LRNNVLGTYELTKAARLHGCRSLVLVSTDKAVRPHSVMGVSKRIAERITVSYSRLDCRMNAIRLSNVTGSTGSVLPIFQEQVAHGGPLTVTDARATRYFLSLHEAVDAILAAALCGCEGRVLLPEFQPPLKIIDLAREVIGDRKGIKIQFIGLRPGEKLHEEWLCPDEVPDVTLAGPLTALQAPRLSAVECDFAMKKLAQCLATRNTVALAGLLMSLVPDYTPSRLMMEPAALTAQV